MKNPAVTLYLVAFTFIILAIGYGWIGIRHNLIPATDLLNFVFGSLLGLGVMLAEATFVGVRSH